mmetsp:Transcript_63970/g.177823  ORF Transcript_63970/g.177823 Transcript_63970/m.177823 type:complete len:205 (+) Transcript_63970:96-710(+)
MAPTGGSPFHGNLLLALRACASGFDELGLTKIRLHARLAHAIADHFQLLLLRLVQNFLLRLRGLALNFRAACVLAWTPACLPGSQGGFDRRREVLGHGRVLRGRHQFLAILLAGLPVLLLIFRRRLLLGRKIGLGGLVGITSLRSLRCQCGLLVAQLGLFGGPARGQFLRAQLGLLQLPLLLGGNDQSGAIAHLVRTYRLLLAV